MITLRLGIGNRVRVDCVTYKVAKPVSRCCMFCSSQTDIMRMCSRTGGTVRLCARTCVGKAYGLSVGQGVKFSAHMVGSSLACGHAQDREAVSVPTCDGRELTFAQPQKAARTILIMTTESARSELGTYCDTGGPAATRR